MMPRGYGDLYQRLWDTPGRLWCWCIHRRMLKVWRQINSADRWPLVTYYCRAGGREHTERRGYW
jgi:hypothetical protein